MDQRRMAPGGASPPIAPSFLSEPASLTLQSDSVAEFSVGVAGRPRPAIQWQTSVNEGATWEDVPGANGGSYSFGAVAVNNDGLQVRAVAENLAGTAVSSAASIVVRDPPVFTQELTDRTVEAGSAGFAVSADGYPLPQITFEQSGDDGLTWEAWPGTTQPWAFGDNAFVHTANLTLADNDRVFRARAVSAAGEAISGPVTITVVQYVEASGGAMYTVNDPDTGQLLNVHYMMDYGYGSNFVVNDPGVINFALVAGGGGGGSRYYSWSSAGGGAGGVIIGQLYAEVGVYPFTIGAGGGVQSGIKAGLNGEDSTFMGLTAIGGGGGSGDYSWHPAGSGGSGGGGSVSNIGNPPGQGVAGQGHDGGVGAGNAGGGGGAGGPGVTASSTVRSGGPGVYVPATLPLSPAGGYLGGGGGAGADTVKAWNVENGGTGGGGRGAVRVSGGFDNPDTYYPSTAGATGTGGGGGGSFNAGAIGGPSAYDAPSPGGSGLLCIWYNARPGS